MKVKQQLGTTTNGKAPGIDCITAELLKTDMELSKNRLHQLLKKIWEHENIPVNRLATKGDHKNSRGGGE